VTPEVARIEMVRRDGRTLSASTRAAPAELNFDARLFVIRAPLELRAPAYHVMNLHGRDGTVIERIRQR
jgi:hypothetical protein